jgi:hypothetical protein
MKGLGTATASGRDVMFRRADIASVWHGAPPQLIGRSMHEIL